MYDSIKDALTSKKVVLFGSYGWGDGDWMNTWKADAEGAGITLAADPGIVNEAPDDVAEASLKALGAALV